MIHQESKATALVACRRDADREDMHHSLELAMPYVNLAFFSLAGADLHLPALVQTLWLAALLFLVRVAAVWLGSFIGCWASDTPTEHGTRMWQTMLTQVCHQSYHEW
jgi:hypothetical protein